MTASKTITRWIGKLFNGRVSRYLQSSKNSSLHKNPLLISFAGRKSGKLYTIPVNYARSPDGTYVIGTEGNWLVNFTEGLDVELQVAGTHIAGHGVVIDSDPDKRERLGRALAGISWRLFANSLTIIEITPKA